MSLVPSLLQAIVKVDGEAMVMHAGDKPYVVSPTGQVELASRGLTLEAVNGIVGQLLPTEIQNALDEFGAIQYELPAIPEFPGEHFTAVAARGGDDVWVEIRRRRMVEDDHVPEEFFASARQAPPPEPPPPVAAAVPPPAPAPPRADADTVVMPIDRAAISAIDEPTREQPAARAEAQPAVEESAGHEAIPGDEDLLLPDATQLWPARRRSAASEPSIDAQASSIDVGAIDALDEEIDRKAPQPAAPIAPPPPPPKPVTLPAAAAKTAPLPSETRETRRVEKPPQPVIEPPVVPPAARQAPPDVTPK